MAYDVIGDIHGQAGKLRALLRRMGYTQRGRGWVPPQRRQAVFVGDLIDRGPEQLEVLDIVRSMIDAGDALAVMGNHEFNAIGYVTPRPDEPGAFLRRHKPGNVRQHAEFLRQVGEGSARHREWVQWFRTLRPALDLGGIRVVHAWWHPAHVETVEKAWPQGQPMSDEFLHAAYDRARPEWAAMEGLTKGLEVSLPTGHSFFDQGGVERFEVRARWWLPEPGTLRDVAIVDEDQRHCVPDLPVPADYAAQPIGGAPVFVGHYWLTGLPGPQTPRLACLDYSAARDGPLVAYRWNGESELDAAAFIAAGG
jgi:hypothetical protein